MTTTTAATTIATKTSNTIAATTIATKTTNTTAATTIATNTTNTTITAKTTTIRKFAKTVFENVSSSEEETKKGILSLRF